MLVTWETHFCKFRGLALKGIKSIDIVEFVVSHYNLQNISLCFLQNLNCFSMSVCLQSDRMLESLFDLFVAVAAKTPR